MNIGMLLFPKLTQLDLTGPYEVLSRCPGATTHLVARTRDPVASEAGLAIVPTTTFDAAPPIDPLFVPGGSGQIAATEEVSNNAIGLLFDASEVASPRATTPYRRSRRRRQADRQEVSRL